jgi:hypothetical protein
VTTAADITLTRTTLTGVYACRRRRWKTSTNTGPARYAESNVQRRLRHIHEVHGQRKDDFRLVTVQNLVGNAKETMRKKAVANKKWVKTKN